MNNFHTDIETGMKAVRASECPGEKLFKVLQLKAVDQP